MAYTNICVVYVSENDQQGSEVGVSSLTTLLSNLLSAKMLPLAMIPIWQGHKSNQNSHQYTPTVTAIFRKAYIYRRIMKHRRQKGLSAPCQNTLHAYSVWKCSLKYRHENPSHPSIHKCALGSSASNPRVSSASFCCFFVARKCPN